MSDECMACRTVVSNNWIQCPKCKSVRCVPVAEKSSGTKAINEQEMSVQTLIETLNSRVTELEEFRTKANARIHRLSDALEQLMFRNEGSEDEHCECVDDDRFPQHNYVCNYHIAKRALEAKP